MVDDDEAPRALAAWTAFFTIVSHARALPAGASQTCTPSKSIRVKLTEIRHVPQLRQPFNSMKFDRHGRNDPH